MHILYNNSAATHTVSCKHSFATVWGRCVLSVVRAEVLSWRNLGWPRQFLGSSRGAFTEKISQSVRSFEVWIEDFLCATVQRYWKCNWKILGVTVVVTEVLVSVWRSVARRRLVENENPSACATVNCNVCKSSIALYLSVTERVCNQDANKSNHPN
jgi:hypothetical protein